MSLKGNAVNEKALIMRLHLLQSILHFHQNQRFDARRLLSLAELEFEQLQIDESSVAALVEMGKWKLRQPTSHQEPELWILLGYTATEARIGLRACSNNIEQALTYIQDRQQQRKKARKIGSAQRKVNASVVSTKSNKWINPRNLHILSEMGFDKNVCVIALQKTDNDINQAVSDVLIPQEKSLEEWTNVEFLCAQISLLQENQSALQEELTREIVPNHKLREQMLAMGFHAEIIDMALKNSTNHMDAAVEELLRLQADGSYEGILSNLLETASSVIDAVGNYDGPSTSSKIVRDIKKEEEVCW